jgi:hypothetical protein
MTTHVQSCPIMSSLCYTLPLGEGKDEGAFELETLFVPPRRGEEMNEESSRRDRKITKLQCLCAFYRSYKRHCDYDCLRRLRPNAPVDRWVHQTGRALVLRHLEIWTRMLNYYDFDASEISLSSERNLGGTRVPEPARRSFCNR